MTTPFHIDFVSDVACPWCVVGLRSLLRALESMGDAAAAEIHFQPFELNPQMGPEGENVAEHIQKKYGSTPEQSAASRQAIKNSGAALGFEFNFSPESRIWNTFDAHRLLHWAGIEGRQLQMKEALFKANFTAQQSTSDHGVLIAAAVEAGLDAKRGAVILASQEFARDVREAEEIWRARGIQAVPSVIINGRWLIQGGQPPEIFEQALREIAKAA